MEMLAEQISKVKAAELGGQEFQLAVLSALLQVILAILLLIPVLAILYIISCQQRRCSYMKDLWGEPYIYPSRPLLWLQISLTGLTRLLDDLQWTIKTNIKRWKIKDLQG